MFLSTTTTKSAKVKCSFGNTNIETEDYFDVMLALQSENKAISEIDSTQKATLYDVMQNAHGLVQALARNILIKTNELIYHEPYILVDTTTTKSAKVDKKFNNPDTETESYINLFPNPANKYVTVEYQIPLNSEDAVLEIVSLNGMHKEAVRLTNGWGEKIVDLRNYNTGTYLVRLYINGKPVENKKFVKL